MRRTNIDRIRDWVRDLRPRNAVQAALAIHAAALSIKLDELRKVEAARTERHRREAAKAERLKRQVDAVNLGHELVEPSTEEWLRREERWLIRGGPAPKFQPRSPELLVLLLEATAEGCRWLIHAWSEMISILDDGHFWGPADQRKAVRLLGKEPGSADSAEIRQMELAYVASGCKRLPQHLGPELTEEMSGRPVPTPAESAEMLRSVARRQIERLLDLSASREESDGGSLHHHFDGTSEGKELRRRQSSAHREMMGALEALARMKKSEPDADIGLNYDVNQYRDMLLDLEIDPDAESDSDLESGEERVPEPEAAPEAAPTIEAVPARRGRRADRRPSRSRGRKRSRKAAKRASQKARAKAKRRQSAENKSGRTAVGFDDPRRGAEMPSTSPEPPASASSPADLIQERRSTPALE
jgi:hypothetical protein